MKLKKLDDAQVEAFDTEYVDDNRWAATVEARINQDFPDGHFTFLDVGGGNGNGNFADRILAQYPNSVGTVLDNSETMLSRNKPNERKTVVLDSVENLEKSNATYDMISLNWVLHHMVGDSYMQSRRNQIWTLKTVKALLTARGRVSIFENLYDGYLVDSLPGRIIFNLTSSKAISGITQRLGANTAGVGVCFLSKKQCFTTRRLAPCLSQPVPRRGAARLPGRARCLRRCTRGARPRSAARSAD